MKQLIRRIILTSGLIVVGLIVVLGAVSYRVISTTVHRVVYKPERMKIIEQERAWLHDQMHARDVSFTTKDGIKIAGMLMLRPGATRNVIICHGHKSAKEMLRIFVDIFPHDNILIFDFRAHGQSEGDLTTFGWNEHLDVLAAAQFLRENPETASQPLYGIGVSMGAASLIHAAAHGVPFKALVIDSTYARLADQIYESFSFRTSLPRFPFLSIVLWLFEWEAGCGAQCLDLCDDLRWIRCPMLIIHSREDSIVSFNQAEQLAACVQGHKSVWFVAGGYHGRISKEHQQEYTRRVREFFDATKAW